MLSRLIGLSLARRWVVLAVAALMVAYGVRVASTAPLDVFPDFTPPQVSLQTEAPGLSADQVEQVVTTRLEGALLGLPGLESLRSQSAQGLSVITATFVDGSDVREARQRVGEQLAGVASDLPDGVRPPAMAPLTSATMDLLSVGFTSDTLPPMALRDLIDTVVRPRLAAVSGVAATVQFGGDRAELQVQVHPERLLGFGLTLQDVLEAARRSTGLLGAGYVETAAQRIVIRADGQAGSAEALANSPLQTPSGLRLTLGDVGTVALAGALKTGDSLIQGRPGIVLKTLSQYGANTLETTFRLEAALEALRPALEAKGVTVHPGLFRPATFIQTALNNIGHSLLLGGALVALVLLLFLLDLRTAFISLTAIPLSLLAAVIVLDALGATLNTLTIGGLVIAIGEVVDDAIIDVENIHRRLRENAAALAPRPPLRVIFEASLEVRSAVVYATFIVCVVFIPVLTMSGLEGRLFAPLGQAYCLAVLASLVVALTVTPALSAVLLVRRAGHGSGKVPWPVRVMTRAYAAVLRGLMAHPLWITGATLFLVAVSLGLARNFGGEFLPEFREGHLVLHVNSVPGTSLAESMRVGGRLSKALLKVPHVVSVPDQVGRATQGEDPWGPNRTEWHINLEVRSLAEENESREGIRAVLDAYPGVRYELTTFLGDRIGETISGETAAVVAELYGEDLDALDAGAQQVAQLLGQVPGAVDVQVSAPPGTPELHVALRPADLTRWQLPAKDALESLSTAYEGALAAQIVAGSRLTDVVVGLDSAARQDPEAIGNLPLRSPLGPLRLRDVADVDLTTGRAMILHEAGRRRQTVTCNVLGRDVASFAAEAAERVRTAAVLPPDTYLAWSGDAQAQAAARATLFFDASLAGVGVVLLLAMVVRHWRNLLLVLLNLPFSLVGGVFAVAFTGGLLSVGSLVGMVTLFGITTRNAIMLVSHYEHLVQVERCAWDHETAHRGATERLVPILMTALVTALGLLPIALGAGEAGREIEGEMAIVILGGLVSSTLLTLLVLPTLAARLAHFAPAEAAEAVTFTDASAAAG